MSLLTLATKSLASRREARRASSSNTRLPRDRSRKVDSTTSSSPLVRPALALDCFPADRSDADSALKLLGKTATWRERKILGNVLYL